MHINNIFSQWFLISIVWSGNHLINSVFSIHHIIISNCGKKNENKKSNKIKEVIYIYIYGRYILHV